jgi:4-hydroxybenzoyl-CoA thioesterase
MSTTGKEITYTARVEFGDCDPAGIVWFPNFFRWIDAASRHFFAECGVPRWEETMQTLGVIGTPLVDTHTRFVKTASYGDTLQIAVRIAEWRDKSFVQTYRVTRGDDLSSSAKKCGSSRRNARAAASARCRFRRLFARSANKSRSGTVSSRRN